MITDEVVSCMGGFFQDGRGPSHDELTRQFRRFQLDSADPWRPGETVGKVKRIRAVLIYALDNNRDAGDRLVKSLIGLIKASGGFRPECDDYAGEETILAAREAFRHEGYDLDPEGNLRQALLEDLEGSEATEALRVYVRRAQVGERDAALSVGTGKDLLEATSRHVLVETMGSYPINENFAVTLYYAFDRLGLGTSHEMLKLLDRDPKVAIEQSLYVLANAVNRLRNAEGTGHGRPKLPNVTGAQAQLAFKAMGLISQLLLDTLESGRGEG